MQLSIQNFKIDYMTDPVGVCSDAPLFSWQIVSSGQNIKQESYRIKVYEWIHQKVWDTGIVKSDETLNIKYRGDILQRDTQYFAELSVTVDGKEYKKSASFRTSLLGCHFANVQWIRPSVSESEYKFSPFFRKTFDINSKEIAFATAYISAKGWYELYINGVRPDDREVMAPACHREYDKAYLLSYDITNLLKYGKNAIGVQLGNGYSEHFRANTAYYGGKRFWAYISVVCTDGSFYHIWTDETWKWHESPIVFDHLYDGEEYDARLEIDNWNMPDFDDAAWNNAVQSKYNESLVELLVEPVRILSSRPTHKITKLADNKFIYDFKYNGSGVIRIKVKGEKGAKIYMHHAENIHDDGTLQPWTNRNALATDIYTLKGVGEEIYTPKFTYHCFRYAQITVEGNAEITHAEALVFGTDMMSKSSFSCSNDMLNRIQQNFIRTLKTNFMSWPCDTGVRDERTACNMDIMVYEEMTIHNCLARNYFHKWLDGGIYAGLPDWSGDSIVLAYLMLKYYGDTELIKKNYNTLCSLAAGIYNLHKEGAFKNAFGDWAAPNPTNDYEDSFSSCEEVAYAMMFLQMNMMSEIARRFSELSDAETFDRYASEAKEVYFDKFYNKQTHLFSNGKQTPNLLAIANGIVVGEEADKVLNALIASIKEKDNSHLDTGIFGTRKLIEVLSRTKEGTELVYKMLNQTTYPSFGQQIVGRDATTAWEQWYNLRGMMTCSHSMFVGIGVDFYKYFAGIKTADNIYKKAIICPVVPDGLSSVDCVLDTPRGIYKVKWNKTDTNEIKLWVTVPANCSATVVLSENTYEIQSGSYEF